jgi:protein TonB
VPAELFRSDLPPTPIRRRVSVLPVSIVAHAVAIAGFVIAPIFADAELPDPPRLQLQYDAIDVVLPPPPPSPRPPAVSPTPGANPDAAPIDAPEQIFPEPLVTQTREWDGATTDGEDGVPDGIFGSTAVGPVQALPAPPPATPQGPVRLGGQIKAPRRTVNVAPVYPSIAQQARVEGEVEIEAVIGEDGRVRDARVTRGKPLLNDAALTAVRQWVFTPTMLNGQAVAVIMTVTVVFTLR